MSIEYKTEGKLDIKCANGNAAPIAVTWMVDSIFAILHGGGCHIELSKAQLLELAEHAGSIAYDLQPNRVMVAKEEV